MKNLYLKALNREAVSTPPIWMMRQAGRYHAHYQGLRAKHSFMDLCLVPELATEVAMGPIQDFDFDAAILFSDLLFPFKALGQGLEYTEQGPRLGFQLSPQNICKLKPPRPKRKSVHKIHPNQNRPKAIANRPVGRSKRA